MLGAIAGDIIGAPYEGLPIKTKSFRLFRARRSFTEAADYEDAVRNAVSLGGDSDTLAAIAGAVGEPLYGIPEPIAAAARSCLTPDLLDVMDRFKQRFVAPGGEAAA